MYYQFPNRTLLFDLNALVTFFFKFSSRTISRRCTWYIAFSIRFTHDRCSIIQFPCNLKHYKFLEAFKNKYFAFQRYRCNIPRITNTRVVPTVEFHLLLLTTSQSYVELDLTYAFHTIVFTIILIVLSYLSFLVPPSCPSTASLNLTFVFSYAGKLITILIARYCTVL